MSDAVLAALITGLCSIIGQYFISQKNRRDIDIKRAVDQQIVNDRLNNIEIKLDVHNGYAEKLGDISRDMAVLATEIKNIKES